MRCPGFKSVLCLSLMTQGIVGLTQEAPDPMKSLRAGQVQAAEAAFDRLIAQSPNDPDLWLGRGLARSRQGLWDAAVQDLEKAVALAPGYADAWAALGDVYRWNDRWAAAADAYARLAALRPQDAQAQILRARALWAMGDAVESRRAAQRALDLGAKAEDVPMLTDKTSQERAALQSGAVSGRGYEWALSGGLGHISAGSASANENNLTLRRYTDWGSMAVERLSLRRWGTSDQAWAVDAYPRLWSGAYANVRYQSSERADLYPHRSWRVELFQNIGSGWELAASHDELGFGNGVKIEGVAVGKYWGNFFVRWRHQSVKSDASSGKGDRVFLRYYYEGDADHYLEVNVSQGRSDDFASALLQTSRSDSRGLAWYHFINKVWGFKLSTSESRDTSAFNARARDASASLIRRW